MARNILRNPNGDGKTVNQYPCCLLYCLFHISHIYKWPVHGLLVAEGFKFWELTENGGNEWRVEDMPGDCGHDFINNAVTKYFTTSFE